MVRKGVSGGSLGWGAVGSGGRVMLCELGGEWGRGSGGG